MQKLFITTILIGAPAVLFSPVGAYGQEVASDATPDPSQAEPAAQDGNPPADVQTEAQQAEDDAYATAKQYMAKGESFFKEGNYEAALTEFERAYAHMEGHPKRFFVLDNIGQCHERLFRYDRALEYYHRYLEEGGADAEDRETVEGVIRTLEGLLATLVIESNVPAEVWSNDRQIGDAPGEVLLPGGRQLIELRARGYETQKKEISIAARERQTYRFELDRLYDGIAPIYFYSGLVLTAGALATGTYFGLRALSAHNDGLDRQKQSGSFANTVQDEEHISRLKLTADLFFAGGAVLGVGTALLYFLTSWDDEAEHHEPTTRVQAIVGPGRVGVQAQGTF